MIYTTTVIIYISIVLNGFLCVYSEEEEKVPGLEIIGGHEIKIGEAPYMVSIRQKHGDKYNHVCGGSIINELHILTAAHCFDSGGEFRVFYSSADLNGKAKIRQISAIKQHEKYSRENYRHDIAVLKLAKRMKLTPFDADAIQLPIKNIDLKKGDSLNVTGWGSNGQRCSSRMLRQVTVPIVDLETCSEAYYRYNIKITQENICAGDDNLSSCLGDGGGPATIGRTQYGIVSFGIDCGNPDFPEVYTNILEYRGWIDVALKDNASVVTHT